MTMHQAKDVLCHHDRRGACQSNKCAAWRWSDPTYVLDTNSGMVNCLGDLLQPSGIPNLSLENYGFCGIAGTSERDINGCWVPRSVKDRVVIDRVRRVLIDADIVRLKEFGKYAPGSGLAEFLKRLPPGQSVFWKTVVSIANEVDKILVADRIKS